MLDIFNKIQTIYNWSSNTDTKTNQIYTWFSNIYNELNSTSTSYMKGKINSIYSWNSTMHNRINTMYNEITSSSSSSVSGQLQSIYDKIVSGGNTNSVIKSIQYGLEFARGGYQFGWIYHTPVNVNKSVLIIDIELDHKNDPGYVTIGNGGTIWTRKSNYFDVQTAGNAYNTDKAILSWQLIEFY